MKILVRSTNWIGDAIMTTPALDRLAALFPDATLAVAARPWVVPVFENNPAVKKIITLRAGAGPGVIAENTGIIAREHFDMAVLFPNSFEAALTAWLARIPERVGYSTDARRLLLSKAVPVPVWKHQRHEVFYYLNLAEESFAGTGTGMAAMPEENRPGLYLKAGEQDAAWCDRMLHQLGVARHDLVIGFNPGAAFGPAKCWPEENFQALGRMLMKCKPDSGGRIWIAVIGTEKERSTAENICSVLGERGVNLAGSTTLSQVMALIARFDLLVTNDSGLMHVGAALQRPLVALFGSTNPVTTGPWSSKSKVVQNPVPCAPCLKRTCPSDFECMKGLAPETVFSACLEQLGQASGITV